MSQAFRPPKDLQSAYSLPTQLKYASGNFHQLLPHLAARAYERQGSLTSCNPPPDPLRARSAKQVIQSFKCLLEHHRTNSGTSWYALDKSVRATPNEATKPPLTHLSNLRSHSCGQMPSVGSASCRTNLAAAAENQKATPRIKELVSICLPLVCLCPVFAQRC